MLCRAMRVRNIRDFFINVFYVHLCMEFMRRANETGRKSARVKGTDEADVQGV